MFAPASASLTEPSLPSLPGIVGRVREHALLTERLTAARAGRGGLVLLSGDAGIGKTTCAELLIADARRAGMLVLTGGCQDLTGTPPYGLWLDLFSHYLADAALPPPPTPFTRRGILGEIADPTTLSRDVAMWVTAVAAVQPVALVLDDLQWADPASLAPLRFLARAAASLPLLIVAAYRTGDGPDGTPLYNLLPTLVREARATRVALRPLRDEDVSHLVDARYHLPTDDAARLVTHLQERAGGNPFFLDELLYAFEEEGLLSATDERWMLGDIAAAPVPSLLRQIIERRFTQVDEATRKLLEIAATVGQEVPLGLWAIAAETDDDTLLAAVEAAVTARIMTENTDGTHACFAHALIRAVLYERIPSARRRRMHRTVAEALMGATNPDPDAVAHHLRQAGDARAVA